MPEMMDLADYNADKKFKIESQNFYRTYIRNDEETKKGVIEARKDWRMDGNPSLDNFEAWFNRSLNDNQRFLNKARDADKFSENLIEYDADDPFWQTYKGNVTMAVYKKSDDSFVGFEIYKSVGRVHYTKFRVILPSLRSQGIGTEVDIAGAKYVFNVAKYEKSFSRVAVAQMNKTPSVAYSDKTEPSDTEDISRGRPIRYATIETTAEGFNAWLNLSTNEAHKNAFFKYSES